MDKDVVNLFYESFALGNGEKMASCYSDAVRFEDPAFGVLQGEDARDMWRMLCSNSVDLQLNFTVRELTESSAEVEWVANYKFGPSRRPVTNRVLSRLILEEGKIVDHRDTFNFWKWSSQALGLPGRFLGWMPPFQTKVRNSARDKLSSFQRQ